MADASLERYINRKRLFVRVQANVPRELFVQKLNAAFPGARIGVGNANAERGPVTQRVADINYESAAEAVQALRRNRFKLKVGNHDADITYQIERKDVVEKLAGEWGCRFMVVVKNLPPGEISCAELSDMFETAGEIFTIKILPGNRGEPYALVQYVEEQSVELCIHQINQQKLHGAVLYVERHLKARRQGGGNSQSSAPPALSSPTAAAPAGNQPLPASSSTSLSSTTPSSRAVSAAAAVAGDTAATTPTATPTNQNARSAAAAGLATQQQQAQQQTQQQQQTPAQQQQAVSQVSTLSAPPISAPPVSVSVHVSVPPSLTSPMLSPTGASTPAQGSHHQLSTAPATPSSQPAKPTVDSSNSLFSNSYALGSKQDSTALFNGGTPSHSSTDNRLGVFGTDLSLITGNPLGVAPGLASPSSLLGPAAAVGGPSLRGATSVPASQGGLGPLGQSSSLGLGGTSGIAASHQVLTPMLDLFSHLREPANQAQSGGGALSASSSVTHSQQLDGLANNMSVANGNGLHGVSTSGAGGNSMSGYAGMLLRSSPGAPTPSTPGSLVSPVGNNANGQGGLGLQSASSIGSQMGGAPGPPGLLVSSGGGRMGAGAVQSTPGLMAHTPAMGPQVGHALPNPQSQQLQQQQQHVVAAAAAASMGLARISIRDSLRLALGRLEEMVMCPLTGEIMRDPVIAADGYSYERTAIQTWMSAHNSSPLSGESLQHKILIPNRLAKDIIADILPS